MSTQEKDQQADQVHLAGAAEQGRNRLGPYANLDAAILEAIKAREHPFYWRACYLAARWITPNGSTERVIDRRLQSMRKRGVIWHATKADIPTHGGAIGWRVTED